MSRKERKKEYEVDYGDLSTAYEHDEEIPYYNGEDDPNDTVDYGHYFGDFG